MGVSKKPTLTKRELWAFDGTSDDFEEGSDNYYAMRALEEYGSATRDNSFAEMVALGKKLEAQDS